METKRAFVITYRSFSAISVLKVLSRGLELRETEVANLNTPIFINEKIGGLQVAMDYVRVATVEPVHTESSVLGHRHTLIERQLNLGVVKKLLNVATRKIFTHDEEVAALSASAHKETDIGMENSTIEIKQRDVSLEGGPWRQ